VLFWSLSGYNYILQRQKGSNQEQAWSKSSNWGFYESWSLPYTFFTKNSW